MTRTASACGLPFASQCANVTQSIGSDIGRPLGKHLQRGNVRPRLPGSGKERQRKPSPLQCHRQRRVPGLRMGAIDGHDGSSECREIVAQGILPDDYEASVCGPSAIRRRVLGNREDPC